MTSSRGRQRHLCARPSTPCRPERLLDLEAGYDIRRGNATFAVNLYDMEFQHEIASTASFRTSVSWLRRRRP